MEKQNNAIMNNYVQNQLAAKLAAVEVNILKKEALIIALQNQLKAVQAELDTFKNGVATNDRSFGDYQYDSGGADSTIPGYYENLDEQGRAQEGIRGSSIAERFAPGKNAGRSRV